MLRRFLSRFASSAATTRRWRRRPVTPQSSPDGNGSASSASDTLQATEDGAGAPAGFEALLQQMQAHGGFTIITRGATWAHVYRDTVAEYARAAYGGLVQHGRVTWQANGTPRFEALRLGALLPRASVHPTLDAVIARLQAGYFEILQRGDGWVDIRRANPERFARFAGVVTYSWHRVRHLHDGTITVDEIPPDGWLEIEIARLLEQGWQREHHAQWSSDYRNHCGANTNGGIIAPPNPAIVLRRRTRFWPQPRRLPSALAPWRMLPACFHWVRDSRPERVRLSLDGDGRVQREEMHASRHSSPRSTTPRNLLDHH